ncbi:polysaccharide lyase family 8 protein [Desarmillaria tabescens]|uniref:Polysaccharide lyase family 8 protein n=1 Tax=Armillaria tabescens TaxID=1929756 RepID=A0AA39NGD3_ARMTA|nr:polysaccharide lyase family 8 protein [Desarmillaria tabescens]KAK0465141.1 polysaccharide lyase family 8 protein [Desarmillaria tabescens]
MCLSLICLLCPLLAFAATDDSQAALTCLAPTSSITPSVISPTAPAVNNTTNILATRATQSTSAKDINLNNILERRLESIISELRYSNGDIARWLSSLDSNGKWSDIDYATGCAAQRANWPAREHWERLVIMTGVWHGGLSNANEYLKDAKLKSATLRGMRWWSDHDFTNPGCLYDGGSASCPCNSAETFLWNPNWFSNVIGVPKLVVDSCLIMGRKELPEDVANHCMFMATRSYEVFDRPKNHMAGANILDVSKIGIDAGLLSSNQTLVADAYGRIHREVVIKNVVKVDGIKSDGSFNQHDGSLYNGNYGKVYSNDVVELELAALGTQVSAGSESKVALARLFEGSRWMIFYNSVTGVLHWDFSVLPRFISFPVIDGQASANLGMNLTAVKELGSKWTSGSLTGFATSLEVRNLKHANAGNLKGNRMFYTNDYMVHRGEQYVSTLRMFSSRTKNTECTNSQNPFGFHLSDGALYTYLKGNEYEDIAAAWDWNLIPGITVDYGATALNCSHSQFRGLSTFVGGVSDGRAGLAAMRYVNPATKSLSWQKTWFFLEDDVQHVMIADISSSTNAPVYSVLDQKRYVGPVVVDGRETHDFNGVGRSKSLWNNNIGYVLDPKGQASITFNVEERRGDWSSIGISAQPSTNVTLFSARLQHTSLNTSSSYTAFPGTDPNTFYSKSRQFSLQSTQNDAQVSAIYDQAHETVFVVFWNESGGSVNLNITHPKYPDADSLLITVNRNVALIYDQRASNVTVSDPSQTLATVNVTFAFLKGSREARSKTLAINFPAGGLSGSSVVQHI